TALGNSAASWTRRYAYEPGTNRLSSTSLPADAPEGPYSAAYAHDAHGSFVAMPHLQTMDWDPGDQLRHIRQGTTEAWYNYDAAGLRARKVVQKQGGLR